MLADLFEIIDLKFEPIRDHFSFECPHLTRYSSVKSPVWKAPLSQFTQRYITIFHFVNHRLDISILLSHKKFSSSEAYRSTDGVQEYEITDVDYEKVCVIVLILKDTKTYLECFFNTPPLKTIFV